MFLSELSYHRDLTGGGLAKVVQDTFAFLNAHEIGHNLECAGNSRLRESLRSTQTDFSSFYQIDFPTDNDFAAWSRIKKGYGVARDLLFLFADLLANMAILETERGSTSLHLLKAFNWWLLRKPEAGAQPRGIAHFLAQSYEYQPEVLYRSLERLLHTAATKPNDMAASLGAFENDGWKALMKNI